MFAPSRRPRRRMSAAASILKNLLLAGCGLFLAGGAMCSTTFGPAAGLVTPTHPLLLPAPPLPVGFYDYFGDLKSPAEARQLVTAAGLDPDVASHYARIGLVHITDELIVQGRDLFFKQFLGDPISVGSIFNFGNAFGRGPLDVLRDSFDPAIDRDGVLSFLRDLFITIAVRPQVATTNLQVLLSRDMIVGSRRFPAGSLVDTGIDLPAGSLIPVGLENGNVSCALCHASVDPLTGQTVAGRPNSDLNIALFLAASPNTTAAFLRLNADEFNPFDPRFPRTGLRILDSTGAEVMLPDPVVYEQAVDEFIITNPRGGFKAAPDGTAAVTKIPDSFTFGEGGMGWDGGFQIGPFGGVAAFSNAVHAFELGLLSARSVSQAVAGIDPEVYLGMILQNASDPRLRVPDGVQPSVWLAETFPGAELERMVQLPHAPLPSLFSLNGLIFSPPGEPVLHSVLALSAFQHSLRVPPNRSPANFAALRSGAVERGADVFLAAGCTSCHPAPFFTNAAIASNAVIRANPARGRNRRALEGRLVDAVLPTFDQMVPLPENPTFLTLPPDPSAVDNLHLPPGLDTDAGGYKVTGLLGTYFKPPYLHDGGVAVSADALEGRPDGGYAIVRPERVGVPGTTKVGRPVDPANSLRALLDRDLRALLVANNRADNDLARAFIDGTGHEFFVDPPAGFTYAQQSDLIDFLLALDDRPGEF